MGIRDDILAYAAALEGTPWEMPPQAGTSVDCSTYVLSVLDAAGIHVNGVRTAEQIRQACEPIAWSDIQKGDLLFFEHTYEPDEPAGPDGHVASHVGISLGAGTFRMWSAQEPVVSCVDINTPYWQEHLFEARRAPQVPAGLIHAIDVSNHQAGITTVQGMDALLASLSTRPSHVIVRLSLETNPMWNQAVAQLKAAQACGCTVGGYLWVYRGNDQREDVRQALRLCANAGVTIPVLWLDIETYRDALPTIDEIRTALDECDVQGLAGGIYTGKWVWDRLGNPSLPNISLWSANYNERPTLDTPAYGDMRLVGHQYSDTPVDRSVFLGDGATG